MARAPARSFGASWPIVLLICAVVHAGIDEDQVLVVYNSASSGAVALRDAYLAAHPGIPADNVLDLDDPSLLVAELSQANFVTKIRDPIRNYLSAPGFPQPADIIAIVLLRPMPHRMLDTDNPTVGDSAGPAGDELLAGDATYASIDAELVLLWQNLPGGEAGGVMDSLSDNVIDNPYHQSHAAISGFNRSAITTAKTFINRQNVAWTLGGSGATRLAPGDLYLVCRIDGTTATDAEDLIDRAQDVFVDRAAVRIILDEYDLSIRADLDDDPLFASDDPFLAGDDYEEARDALEAAGWDVLYDDTFDFIYGTEETTPLVAYASYGENHDIGGAGENPPGAGTYIESFNFAPGAMFNTVESFNARAFNGLGTLAGHEQVADFITAGGTFGVGYVFEPFTFTIFDNEFLFTNMLIHGRCWAEAAYSSIPALSWQHLVVGDPLGRIRLLGDFDDDGDLDPADSGAFVDCVTGPEGPLPPGCRPADFDGDDDSDLYDYARYQLTFAG